MIKHHILKHHVPELRKDDYMLDGKHATKAEVFNLLETRYS